MRYIVPNIAYSLTPVLLTCHCLITALYLASITYTPSRTKHFLMHIVYNPFSSHILEENFAYCIQDFTVPASKYSIHWSRTRLLITNSTIHNPRQSNDIKKTLKGIWTRYPAMPVLKMLQICPMASLRTCFQCWPLLNCSPVPASRHQKVHFKGMQNSQWYNVARTGTPTTFKSTVIEPSLTWTSPRSSTTWSSTGKTAWLNKNQKQ